MYSKASLLDKALEVAKEHARSGNTTPVELVLRKVYEELKKIDEELGD